MSTHAPLQPLERATSTSAHDQTAPLEADRALELDSLPLLDHRTRTRTISARLAPRGHYLAATHDNETRLIPLDTRITHIGRGLSAEIRLEHAAVSRSHAIVVQHGGHARLLDNRSANGTFLNGRRIVAANVANGDVITLGPLSMRYVEVT